MMPSRFSHATLDAEEAARVWHLEAAATKRGSIDIAPDAAAAIAAAQPDTATDGRQITLTWKAGILGRANSARDEYVIQRLPSLLEVNGTL